MIFVAILVILFGIGMLIERTLPYDDNGNLIPGRKDRSVYKEDEP